MTGVATPRRVRAEAPGSVATCRTRRPERRLAAEEALIHVLWINAGLSCDGDSVALTAATQPSIEEIALGALPGPARRWPCTGR